MDGIYQRRSQSSLLPIEKRVNTTMNIAEDSLPESSNNLQSKKKKVRWADIEENALHLHKKAGRICQQMKKKTEIFDSLFFCLV